MHAPTIAAALTLAALAPVSAVAQDAPYKAVGTEPFWSLTIDARTMRFEAPDRRPVTVPTPKVIHGFAGEIYQTPRMNVNVTHTGCSDGMSDRHYRDAVTVTFDGRTWRGCGGGSEEAAPAPSHTPIDGAWRIHRIDGQPTEPGSDAIVTFRDGRMNGNTGCNMFNGSYRFARGRLTAGPLATTRRGCIGTTGAQEQRLLALFSRRLSVSSNRNGKLVLTARDGRTLVLARGGRR
jgi:uncharacterized membrane protein